MKKLDAYLSTREPAIKNGMWLKPVDGGFTLYVLDAGKWQPVKLVDDNNTSSPGDDTKEDADTIKAAVIGTSKDTKNKATIYGAKAYTDDAVGDVVGTASDTASDLTLYGLKAYIDSKTE